MSAIKNQGRKAEELEQDIVGLRQELNDVKARLPGLTIDGLRDRFASMALNGLLRSVTSMIGNSQGEAEIPHDLAEGVLPTGKVFA